jgi:hypothetical protein
LRLRRWVGGWFGGVEVERGVGAKGRGGGLGVGRPLFVPLFCYKQSVFVLLGDGDSKGPDAMLCSTGLGEVIRLLRW